MRRGEPFSQGKMGKDAKRPGDRSAGAESGKWGKAKT